MSSADVRRPLTLRLRPDAHDPPGRWDAWIERHQGTHDIELDTSASLAEALDDLASDTALQVALGAEYCAHHLHMKRVEVGKCEGKSPEEARDFLIWFV